MPYLVYERGRDTVPDHAFPRDTDDGDRSRPTAGQPGAGSADGTTGSTVQVADDRRRCGHPGESVRCRDVQTGQPHSDIVLASLGQRVGEQIELVEYIVESPAQPRVAPLLLGRTGPPSASVQPAKETVQTAAPPGPTRRQDLP